MGKTNEKFKRYVKNRLIEMDFDPDSIVFDESEAYDAIAFPVLTEYDIITSCIIEMDKEEREITHVTIAREVDTEDPTELLMKVNELNMKYFGMTFIIDFSEEVMLIRTEVDILEEPFEDCWGDIVDMLFLAQQEFIEFD